MSSWQDLLRARLATRPNPKVAILGIGHELRGDDAAGVVVARELQAIVGATLAGRSVGQAHAPRPTAAEQRTWADLPLRIIDAGAAPEAFTGPLRRFAPNLVIMIDAAQMDRPPGAIRAIEWPDAIGLSASTHTLPLNVIAQYLVGELACEVIILGLQAAANDFDTPLSPPMRRAVDEVTLTLAALLTSISA